MKNIICPISDQRVNEQVTRINAFFVIALVISGLIFHSVALLFLLMSDFFIRAYTEIKLSPIAYASSFISNALSFPVKLIDKAPKIFAARLGFVMTALIVLLMILKFDLASLVVGGILVFFAGLEFFLAICVGCRIYTYLILPFYKK